MKLIQVNVRMRPWWDVSTHAAGMSRRFGLKIYQCAVGPRGDFCLLGRYGRPDVCEKVGDAIFPKLRLDEPQDYVLLRYDGESMTQVDITGEPSNWGHMQPLGDDEWLFVAPRVGYQPGNQDLNASVYGSDGRLRRKFLLGDGIQDVQTTPDGRIWVSYFDEGVFGNFGWHSAKRRLGRSGLTRWNGDGRLKYEYGLIPGRRPRHDGILPTICDCYGLNVVDDRETWLCYDSEHVVHLVDGRMRGVWDSPVRTDCSLAVWGDYILFYGFKDYDWLGKGKYRRQPHRLIVHDASEQRGLRPLFEVGLQDADGGELDGRLYLRGARLFAVAGMQVFVSSLSEILSAARAQRIPIATAGQKRATEAVAGFRLGDVLD